MRSLFGSADDSWTDLRPRVFLETGAVWGVALATMELAYSTPANDLFPVGSGHFLLWLLLVGEYVAVAWVGIFAATVTRPLWGALGPALRLAAGPWILLTLLAVSFYRDHLTLVRPQGAGDGILTVGIFLVCGALFLLTAIGSARRKARVARAGWMIAGVVLCLGSAVAFFAASPRAETVGETVTADDVGPIPDTGLRVLVIGLDGGSWKVLDPLVRAGRMPTFAALGARGVTARMHTVIPTYSPNIWTTVATGMTLEKHGVKSHVFTRLPLGLPAVPHFADRWTQLTKVMKFTARAAGKAGLFSLGVYGSENVRVPRIWDVAGEFGMRSFSLSWYVTHPARPVAGIQVSDRFHLLAGGGAEEAVFPGSLAPELVPQIVSAEEARDRVLELVDLERLDESGRAELMSRFPEVFDTLAREMARDMTTRNLIPGVSSRVPDWRLALVYYRGMDGSHHMTWKYRDLPPGADPDHPEWRFRRVVDGYYEVCDGFLRDALALADENTVVFALSDHGWDNAKIAHSRKPDGFFVMAGGPVLPRTGRTDVSVYDVAPTVLALLGIPVPEDMDGKVAVELIDPAFWEEFPVRNVPSYYRPFDRRDPGAGPADDDAVLEQLRALGYVGD